CCHSADSGFPVEARNQNRGKAAFCELAERLLALCVTTGQVHFAECAASFLGPARGAVKGGFVELAVKVANVSGATLTGPLNLIVRTTQNYEVVSRSGVSVNDPAPFVALRGTLPTGQAQYLTIRLKAPNISFTPTFELWTGSGAF
ncbi:MAG: hypothetical protein K8R88_09100, partial [Armatimonadetes bacterium]|nr:hypothetical protein [Armatimonadota bacterium]